MLFYLQMQCEDCVCVFLYLVLLLGVTGAEDLKVHVIRKQSDAE